MFGPQEVILFSVIGAAGVLFLGMVAYFICLEVKQEAVKYIKKHIKRLVMDLMCVDTEEEFRRLCNRVALEVKEHAYHHRPVTPIQYCRCPQCHNTHFVQKL